MKTKFDDYKKKLIDCLYNLDMRQLEEICNIIQTSDVIYTCGNGGAATASIHMANDLQKMGSKKAISLASNISLVTAWANDDSYDVIFRKQLEILCNKRLNNTLILLSGSGTSKNIVDVGLWAMHAGFNVILITGNPLNSLRNYKGIRTLCVDASMQITEDMFMVINHMIAMELREQWMISTTTLR